MQEHHAWIKHGFDQGIFLLTGSIQPNLGGVIIAVGVSKQVLEDIENIQIQS